MGNRARTFSIGIAAVAVVAFVAVCSEAATGASGASGVSGAPTGRSKKLATEVCEDMVRDAAVAAAGEALVTPQHGDWTGSQYTCRYAFRDGALVVGVEVLRTETLARERFVASRKRDGVIALHGIGQQAFESHAGAIVARKDRFVLTVDPSGLPGRLDTDAIVYATARAVFDCW